MSLERIEPIQHELTDKDLALALIGAISNRTSLSTIIKRLQSVENAVQLSALLVCDQLLTQTQVEDWITKFVSPPAAE